jgi:hypothetical protein
MCVVPDGSRIDAGRRRAAAAKRAVALTAAGSFVVTLALARQAHPGTAAANPTPLSPPSGLSSEVNQGFSLGGGSIGPSSGGRSGSSSAPSPPVQSSSS